jgi:sigma-B regulation protein RsbU (phosphoserine phosphatase)
MSETLRITIFEDHRKVLSQEYSHPVELGRQDRGDDEVYCSTLRDGRVRIPMARKDETAIARKQLFVQAQPDGRVRLSNQSTEVRIRLPDDQSDLMPTSSQDLPLPVTLHIGSREVRIEAAESSRFESLAEAPLPPGVRTPDHSLLNTIAADRTTQGESLIPWLQATLDLIQGATSLDCYDRAASALVEMIGLDAGRVLMLEGSDWFEKAVKLAPHRAGQQAVDRQWKPSTQILNALREQKKTFWQVPAARDVSLYGVKGLVAAPILDRQNQVIGALYGDRGEASGGPFAWRPITRVHAMLAQLLASGVAAGLAHKKLVEMERDLEIGRQIQAGFLPKELPQARGWELAAHFQPAREVSGDFYDAFSLPDSHLALVIADVCDKGVGPALYMALFRSLLRAFAGQAAGSEQVRMAQPVSTQGAELERSDHRLAEFVARSAVELTNNYVIQSHWQSMFCTLFFGVLETASGLFTYINAGHGAPVLLGAAGVKARLSRTGPAVGLMEGAAYEVKNVRMEPGDTLFAYTDGVTDARDPSGQFFTEKRLLSILQMPVSSVPALVHDMFARLHEHTAGTEPYDDVTMLAVRRVP